MISANGGFPAHRYTPQVTDRWPRGSEPVSMLGTEVCTPITYLGHDVNWAQRGDTRSPLDIMTGK